MRVVSLFAGVVAAISAGAVDFAQSQTPFPPDRPSVAQPECQRGAGGVAPGETTGSSQLSDQLSQSKGVICPPAGVDPGIAAPPLGGGRTPVIPPPGTPGGDPSIVPK
jgi:hypothetical protein